MIQFIFSLMAGISFCLVSIGLRANENGSPRCLKGVLAGTAVQVNPQISQQKTKEFCDDIRTQLKSGMRGWTDQNRDHLEKNVPRPLAAVLTTLKDGGRKKFWPRVLVLSGKSGAGKSMLLKFCFDELQYTGAVVNSSNFCNEFFDSGVQNINAVFAVLNEQAKQGPVLFGIENITQFVAIDAAAHHLEKRMTRALWKQIQKMSENIVVLGTTLEDSDHVEKMLPKIKMRCITLSHETGESPRLDDRSKGSQDCATSLADARDGIKRRSKDIAILQAAGSM